MGIHPDHGSTSESDRNYYTDFAGAPELDGDHPNPLHSNPPATDPKPQPSQDEYPPEKTRPQDGYVAPLASAHPTGTYDLNATMPPAFSHEHPQPPPEDAKEAEARPATPGTPFLYFEPPPTYAESNGGGGGSNSYVNPDEKPPLPPRRAKTAGASGKMGFGDRLLSSVTELASKASGPVNRLTNRLGSEAFWPSSLDKECDKAARILTSFCTGFYSAPTNHLPSPSSSPSPSPNSTSTPQQQQQQKNNKVFIQIPRSAIATAQGLAIFTTLRGGFQISGAAGSGLVVARLPDGTWSPPSAFSVTALGAGLVAGLDIHDCVCVLHTREAVDAFTRPRWSLGAEVGVTAGPVGGGVSGAAALKQKQQQQQQGRNNRDMDGSGSGSGDGGDGGNGGNRHGFEPIWTYAKSRGLYVGLQAEGTVIVQRPDANAAFYGERGITAERILRGQVARGVEGGNGNGNGNGNSMLWPEGTRRLVEALKMAEGRGADESVIREIRNAGPTPGDLGIGAVAGGGDAEAGWVDGGGSGEKGGPVRDSVLYK